MPERWERELEELRHMEMRETAIRERIERGPSVDRGPSRRNALLAGIVAGAVVIAGIGALWQLDRNTEGIGDPLPLSVETPSPELGVEDFVTIDIRRASEKTGDPEAIARFGSQEEWMCPDGWRVVNPDGTTDEVLFDCGQETTFTAPAGASIVVSGDFVSVNATARLSAPDDRTSYDANEVPAIDAQSVVFYQYKVSWDDGSEASFWLLLTVSNPERPSPDPGSGAVEAASSLRVRCHADEPAEVLTTVVSTHVDGLHVVPVDTPADWEILLFSASDERQIWAAGSDDTDDEFARPVPPGQAGVACIDHETITGGELEQAEGEASPFLLTDPDGLFTPYVPECDMSDQASYHWRLDGVDIDDAVDRLRTIPGVRQDDIIQLAGYDWEWGSARVWRIVRDGRIIAGLSVVHRGLTNGFVCRSSGITGDEP